MSTIQEAFDVAAIHMLGQGVQSMCRSMGRPTCAYRGHDGLKCGIGALISDEAYAPYLEGYGVLSDNILTAIQKSGWPIGDDALAVYTGLQHIHDQISPLN
jgi:hypothetical protein